MKKIILCLTVALAVIMGTVTMGCVKKKSLESLEIASLPNKTVYNAGENFDRTGLVVKAVYSDKSKKTIDEFKVDKDKMAYGDRTVTVSYKRKKAYIDVTVKDYSVYGISVDVPGELKADTDYNVDVSLRATEERDLGYDSALIFIEVEKPDGTDVSLNATDTLGNSYDVVKLGQWGPPSGFPISVDYNATTRFTARFSHAGEYVIKISAFSLNGQGQKDKEIAKREITATVGEKVDAAVFGPIAGLEKFYCPGFKR